MSASELLHTGNILHIRHSYKDGRVICLCVWDDGEWKIEVFASERHARDFADKHNMEVVNHARDKKS